MATDDVCDLQLFVVSVPHSNDCGDGQNILNHIHALLDVAGVHDTVPFLNAADFNATLRCFRYEDIVLLRGHAANSHKLVLHMPTVFT